MDRRQLRQEQDDALGKLDAARRDLLKLPNVLAVGLGFKETAGQFTKELSFRVYVTAKQPDAVLGANAIPKVIAGIKTDVLTPLRSRDDSDVCGTERRTLSKHRPLFGGIAVGRDTKNYGTLGWFGTLEAGGALVLISNKHVLYGTGDEVTTVARNVGQPRIGKVSKCCCCECGSDNVVAETIVGVRNISPMTTDSVDVALARISPALASEVLFEITNDTTDEVLTVDGHAQAVVGETVRKIGARSGFTRGTVIHIGDMAAAPVDPHDPDGGTISVKTGHVLIIPADDETYEVKNEDTEECMRAFSNDGDSGSVILNDDDEIVALNRSGNREDYSVGVTIACNIQTVLDQLAANGFAIRLSRSSDGGDSERIREPSPLPGPVIADVSWLERARDMNRSSALHWLVDRHQHEVLQLVNHKRPVTVAWQRHRGPAFVAALARSSRALGYRVPFEIEGVARDALLTAMERALLAHGSDGLKRDMARYRQDALELSTRGETIAELAFVLKERGLIDHIPTLASERFDDA